jgi:hypothetical protein
MALRVTARLAQRLGTMAPIHSPENGKTAGAAVVSVGALGISMAQLCKAKCAVRALIFPANTA